MRSARPSAAPRSPRASSSSPTSRSRSRSSARGSSPRSSGCARPDSSSPPSWRRCRRPSSSSSRGRGRRPAPLEPLRRLARELEAVLTRADHAAYAAPLARAAEAAELDRLAVAEYLALAEDGVAGADGVGPALAADLEAAAPVEVAGARLRWRVPAVLADVAADAVAEVCHPARVVPTARCGWSGSVMRRPPRPRVRKLNDQRMSTRSRFWKPIRYQRWTTSHVAQAGKPLRRIAW